MTPEQVARRQELGIPVHLEETDHDYRADGYCNCGALQPHGTPRAKLSHSRRSPLNGSRRGIVNLDVIERSPGGDRA